MSALRLIATDLDGTLLRPDESVSRRTRRALDRAREAGLAVVLVTGRPPRWVRALAVELGLGTPVICANGAIVYDAAGHRLLSHHPMPAEAAVEIVSCLRQGAPGVRFAFEMGLEFAHEPAYLPMTGRCMPERMLVGDALDLASRPVTKLLARHDALSASQLARRIEGAARRVAEPTWSTPYLLEVAAAGVTKARALSALCRSMGLPAEAVVAFGDMPNDLPMLEWAGLGYAVANADPAVKAGADRLAASNAEDGVARVIEALLAELGNR